MKTIDLSQHPIQLLALLTLAQHEPIVVIAPDGREYMLAEADNFAHEVALLQASPTFQQFLDERLATRHQRRPITAVLDDIEREIARESIPS